jgi:hypothetical protein
VVEDAIAADQGLLSLLLRLSSVVVVRVVLLLVLFRALVLHHVQMNRVTFTGARVETGIH